ncbi:MAG: response regulator, partial [Gammaproteobacteria bacterium]
MTQSTAPTAVQKTRYKPERRVLVVDDDEDFADSLAEFLETCGYSVCLAHDPHSAEEAIRQSQPQVAILDIRLSQTSGIELLSRISDSHPDITCLMMTADPGTNLPIESLRRGAYDYLRKPVKHEDLLGSLTRCFNKIFLEQKKAMVEQALQLSEERYRALYDNNPMMFLTVDEQGTVCSVNEYGAAQLGHRVDDLIGSPLAEVFYQEDRETLSDCLRACFEEPDKVHHWELRQVRGDGSILWSRETVRVVNQKTSEATALIVCEDITETRRLSEQLSYHASH